MGINFVPDPGDVLMCDFTDLRPPEITKKRRVVVLSPRCRTHFPGTILVVPISKSPPSPPEAIHHEFPPRAYHFFDNAESVWALCNMVMAVKFERLDRMKINGRYTRTSLRMPDLDGIRNGVAAALGLLRPATLNGIANRSDGGLED